MTHTYDVFDTPSGRTVVLALDTGRNVGALDGVDDPESTLRAVLGHDPDGVAHAAVGRTGFPRSVVANRRTDDYPQSGTTRRWADRPPEPRCTIARLASINICRRLGGSCSVSAAHRNRVGREHGTE